MKKMLLVLFVVLVMAVPVFANNDAENNFSPNGIANTGNNNVIYGAGSGYSGNITATGGAGGAGGNASATGGSVNIGTGIFSGGNFSPSSSSSSRVDNDVKNTNTNTNIDVNTDINNNKQGQGQKQFGFVNIETPRPFLSSPSQGVPELNFGNGRMTDATNQLPNFALFGIKKLGAKESIREVIDVDANVKFKNLYKSVLSTGKKIANGQSTADIRYQIIRAEAQKTWTTGGNIGAAGSGLGTQAGGAAAGSVIPQWGGTKADDLFTIIFIRVLP